MNKKVTCRPCKEQGNWEIQDQNGVVLQRHYTSKEACIAAGEKLANESSCELFVEESTKA